MADKPTLLFLIPRFPYPPTKGEKIHAWHYFLHLAKTHKILLGCLIDEEVDPAHVDHVRQFCAELVYFPIKRATQKIKALVQFRPGRPLMLDYNWHPGLAAWAQTKLGSRAVDVIYLFSTVMAPYVLPFIAIPFMAHANRPIILLDMVDVDSEKWREYSLTARWPMRAIWAREARTLLAYERMAAMAADLVFLVSQPECTRFRALVPEVGTKLHSLENGVDLEFFAPAHDLVNPYASPGPHLALVGHMDYWPNIDAAIWFATEILPKLQKRYPTLEFAVIGANPVPEVQNLRRLPGVTVTGRVTDVRPYVAHAAAAVIPLRIARGIQNKVLEAMALGRPVVVTPQAFEGVRATAGHDLLVADGADALVAKIGEVLDGKHPDIGRAARGAMEAGYSWASRMELLDRLLDTELAARRAKLPTVTSKDVA